MHTVVDTFLGHRSSLHVLFELHLFRPCDRSFEKHDDVQFSQLWLVKYVWLTTASRSLNFAAQLLLISTSHPYLSHIPPNMEKTTEKASIVSSREDVGNGSLLTFDEIRTSLGVIGRR